MTNAFAVFAPDRLDLMIQVSLVSNVRGQVPRETAFDCLRGQEAPRWRAALKAGLVALCLMV